MKAIRLTEEQRSKLLEMCRVLFPSYKNISMYHNGWEFDTDMEYLDFNHKSIHWFEFCMTHLINGLYHDLKYHDSESWDINLHVSCMSDLYNFNTNPIDYLYKEFEKINKD